MKYPELAFKGQTVYSRTLVEVEKSVEELLNFVQAKKEKEGKAVLGFDIEWRPTFIRGLAPLIRTIHLQDTLYYIKMCCIN